MKRIIPKSSRVKMNLFKDFSLLDIAFMLISAIICSSLALSNFNLKWWFLIGVVLIDFVLLVKIDEERVYVMLYANLVHLTSKKNFEANKKGTGISEVQAIKVIKDNILLFKSKTMYAKVLELEPIAFSLLSEEEQDNIISRFGKTFDILSEAQNSEMEILKLLRPFKYKEIIDINSNFRADELNEMHEKGILNDNEFVTRLNTLLNNQNMFEKMHEERALVPHFFMQITTDYINDANKMIEELSEELSKIGLKNKVLDTYELAVFVANAYTPYIDDELIIKQEEYSEKDVINLLMPTDIKIRWNKVIAEKTNVTHLTVADFPLEVDNGWGFDMFHITNSRATMKFKIIDNDKAKKMMDKSLSNLRVKRLDNNKDSEDAITSAHIESLQVTTQDIALGRDHLYEFNMGVTTYDYGNVFENRKKAKRTMANGGFRTSYSYGETSKWYLSDELTRIRCGKSIGITSNSLAASFPFVSFNIIDRYGIFIGASEERPCMLDIWARDGKDRVNSNAFVVGQSGMGKSYFIKTMIVQQSTGNVKIIVMEPENEYADIVKNLGGVSIDVASNEGGRINPLEIIQEMADEKASNTNTYFNHLLFLESFFNVVIPNLTEEAFEYLSAIIVDLYKEFGIDENTDLNKLTSKDYPIFDDLLGIVNRRLKEAKNDYDVANLRSLKNNISKFAEGGRYSNLWNGKTTLKMDSNIIAFNFQTLLIGENKTLSNAQNMLVLRLCNLEVIKNKEMNDKLCIDRKIMIVVDEAHVFFDKDMPQALNFFSQMARRIRKYSGSIVFTTQNIGDFVSSAEVADKTKAIINACQYSFVFHLPANGLTDLLDLYKKANNSLNDSEADFVKNAGQGEMFTIVSEKLRIGIKVIAPDYARSLFGEKKEKAIEIERSEVQVIDVA